jgi:hypothetical protein
MRWVHVGLVSCWRFRKSILFQNSYLYRGGFVFIADKSAVFAVCSSGLGICSTAFCGLYSKRIRLHALESGKDCTNDVRWHSHVSRCDFSNN